MVEHLVTLASKRAETAAMAQRDEEGAWVIVAESTGRRAELDVDGLIDQFLPRFAARVDAL